MTATCLESETSGWMKSGFRDEGGVSVLLGEGARMQIHISIFLISVLRLRRRPFVLRCCHQSAQRGTDRTVGLFVHSSCLATLSHPGGSRRTSSQSPTGKTSNAHDEEKQSGGDGCDREETDRWTGVDEQGALMARN